MIKKLGLSALIIAALVISVSTALAKNKAKGNFVSDRAVELLASGDLKKAIFEMREASSCAKTNYLMHQANRIVLFDMEKKPSKAEAHELYQNVAIAYHNLYLFLKTKGVDQEDFLKGAKRYYGKARRAGTYLHRAECDLLLAALIASGGEVEKARKKFLKIDELMLRGDFESMEYLAAYHAAVGDAIETIDALEAALTMDAKRVLKWLEVSDDFESLKDDPAFIAMIGSWKAKGKSHQLTLCAKNGTQPRLEMTGTDPYSPLGYSKKAKRQLNAKKKN